MHTPAPRSAGLPFWGVGRGVTHGPLGNVAASAGGGGWPGGGERGLPEGHRSSGCGAQTRSALGGPVVLPGGLWAGASQQSRFPLPSATS